MHQLSVSFPSFALKINKGANFSPDERNAKNYCYYLFFLSFCYNINFYDPIVFTVADGDISKYYYCGSGTSFAVFLRYTPTANPIFLTLERVD